MPILPENINNDDSPFLFQQTLYVGLEGNQYEVSERFEKNEADISDLKYVQQTNADNNIQVNHRIGTLEQSQTGQIQTNQAIAQTLSEHADDISENAADIETHIQDSTVHVDNVLRNHPTDLTKHLPPNGSQNKILAFINNNPYWETLKNLLPQELQDIIDNNGNLTVSAKITTESLYDAMMRTIASYWENHPINPFRHSLTETMRIYSGVYGERFVMVGEWGRIAWSYTGEVWRAADNYPFGENAMLVDVCYGADTNNESLYLAIDKTNRYAFSSNGRSWIPAFTYSEALVNTEFRCCVYGDQTFLIFTDNGRILRATFSQTSNPWITNAQGKVTGINWDTQKSPDGTSSGMYDACFGNGIFVGVGVGGKIITSTNATHWIQEGNFSGGNNLYGVAFGVGRFVAVGAQGKIGYSNDGKVWHVIEQQPFGEHGIYSVTYGFGSFMAADVNGQVATSVDGIHWTTWETPVNSLVRAICFGNLTIVMGTDSGEIVVSESLSKKFSEIGKGDFQEYKDSNVEWFQNIEKTFVELQELIHEALKHKPNIGTTRALGDSFVTPENEHYYIGTVGVSFDAAPIDHQHPSNLCIGININSAPLTELGTAGGSNMAARYDHTHPTTGLELLTRKGQANGYAPLDGQTLIPLQYLRHGWDWSGLYETLNRQNVNRWTILNNPMFEDIVTGAVIYGIAATTSRVVAVGNHGRIGYGSHVKRLHRADDSPFDNRSVIGVAAGTDNDNNDFFIIIDTENHYSTSYDGNSWTNAVELDIDADIEGIIFGGGRFLIWDSNGYIYRSVWVDGMLTFERQISSPLNTEGLRSICFGNGIYVGVGDNKIVTSPDAESWALHVFPADTSPLMHVFFANGLFIAVGLNGTIITSPDGVEWTKQNSGRTDDFYSGCYYDGVYLVGGQNGTIIVATNQPTNWSSPLTTNVTSIIRVLYRHSDVFVLADDAGQIACSSTFRELLGMIVDETGNVVIPSSDSPLPLATVAEAGLSLFYARGDHVHPTQGLVTVTMMGIPLGVATLDEYGYVLDSQLKRGLPNGIAPLGENSKVPDAFIGRSEANGVAPLNEERLIPKEFIPPIEVNIEQVINVINGGYGLEFLEQISPFPQGIGVSAIIHDGTFGNGVHVLVGETGIGYCEEGGTWTLSATQPFDGSPVVGAAFGQDNKNADIFVVIDTTKQYSVSRNGKTWGAAYEMEDPYDFEAITYFNHTFLILCSEGVVLHSVFSNGNLTGWVEQTGSPNVTAFCNDIEGGNGIIVIVGNTGRIRVSDDADHFTVADLPITDDLLTVTFGKGTFLIGGENNTLITGTNKTDFHKIVSPFTGNAAITGTGYNADKGIFVITNANGEVATSSNLVEWTKHTPQPTNVRIKAIVTGNNKIVLGDDSGNIFSSRIAIEIKYPENNNNNCDCENEGSGNGEGGNGGTFNGTMAWENVTEKPESFPPSEHTHTVAEITDLNLIIEEIAASGGITITAKSAYQSWLEQNGNAGKTETEFVQSLKGSSGVSAYGVWLAAGNSGTLTDFLDSLNGKSLYEEWIEAGNTGTLADFLATLKGENGKSLYEEWIEAGNIGTLNDFLATLKGGKGDKGDTGAFPTIPAKYIFVDDFIRDGYFADNVEELITGMYVITGSNLQCYSGDVWVDIITAIQGEQGETPDLSDYATKSYVDSEIEKIEHPETGGGESGSGEGDPTNVWIGKITEVNEENGTVSAKLLDENGEANGEIMNDIILLDPFNANTPASPTPILGYVSAIIASQQSCIITPFGGGTPIVATFYVIDPEIGNSVIATYQNGGYVAMVTSQTTYDNGENTYVHSAGVN